MSKTANRLNLIDTMITEAAQKGLLHLTADSDALDGRIIHLDGRPLINFGVCSYLGLEMDPRLKQGTIDAVLRYGTQFASSRGYLSAPPYSELELLLQRIVDAPVLITPTTTLGHLAAIPTLIGEEDAVLMDQQVHNGVQMAVEHVRAIGTSVEVLRHNDMQALDKRLSELSTRYQRVWYLADGVYSMFGDVVPLEELRHLLHRYKNLHLYLDDAHGMSWTGPHGRGYVLSHLPERDRVVVALSMAKGFAAGGGVLVFPDTETLRRVRTCGGPMIFSGPVQPPMLGAAIASARIHLSQEITCMQQELLERIHLCNDLMQEKGLPLVSPAMTPIRFVATGWTRVAQNLMHRLMEVGFFPNIVGFPAVPLKQSGIRITITLHHSEDDIRSLVDALAYHLPLALQEEGSGLSDIAKFFSRSLHPLTTLTPNVLSRSMEHSPLMKGA
ncbi:MAG TPA: aminotransferase class I/II-fold pyridoxal phosphate-dependent enzyme [Ktedonobacteraceae bacterium]|nr:aminotransferase class I/II-fold pyridoxal phosphate-dependent enzyme [Ktedonobacteraceae bacterium]